jgi:hypothetical protein
VKQPEWLSKLDVARRQVCGAIRLFFERGDPVVLHSIISGAHQVLSDLGAKSGMETLLRAKSKSGEHYRAVNYAANFFKHADKDAEARINVEPLADLNEEFLMDAAFMLLRLCGNSIPTDVKVYMSWFVMKHEDLFDNVPKESVLFFLKDHGMDPDDFKTIRAFLTSSDLHEYAIAHGAGQSPATRTPEDTAEPR